MGRSILIPMSTSELMDQRTSSLCTLVSYNNLALVVITWHTTMDDVSPLMTKIMITGVSIVLLMLAKVKEVDGGLVLAFTVHQPDHTQAFTGTRLAPI